MAEAVIAVDSNILVYAHRDDAPFHDAARRTVIGLAEGRAAWAIPWPCLHEFVCVATHPRVYQPPTNLSDALGQVEAWLASPGLVVLGEPPDYWSALARAARAAHVAGPLIYDARIATICQLHGVRELWTADHDFTRFPGITTFNPLVVEAARGSAPTYGAHRRARIAGRRRAKRQRHQGTRPE